MSVPRAVAAKPRMEALSVIDSLATGGAERSLIDLIPKLRAHGIDTTMVILKNARNGLDYAVEQAEIPLIRLHDRARWAQLRALRELVTSGRFSLVQTTLVEASILARIATWRSGIPVLATTVSTTYAPSRYAEPGLNRRRLRTVQVIDGVSARIVPTHFHAITDTVRNALRRDLKVPSGRITVIPRGRDQAKFAKTSPDRKRAAREKLGLPEGVPLFVNVGRQEYPKGQVHLIPALAHVRASFPNAQLVIAGRPSRETPRIEALANEHGVRDALHLIGFRDNVQDVLTAADVFVFPSLFEGLGCALIEAMAVGLPIIASRISATEEVLGDAALFVAPKDEAGFANAMRSLLEQPDQAQALAERGHARYLAHFTLDAVAAATADLYRALAGGAQYACVSST